MRYQKINRELFINNRFKFNQKTSDNSLTVFNSNDQMPTNADGTMPFKQNSDLFWMTGINQEDTALIIAKINGEIFEKLYIKETNEHISIWEGEKCEKSAVPRKDSPFFFPLALLHHTYMYILIDLTI